jgi:hypothetical protein
LEGSRGEGYKDLNHGKGNRKAKYGFGREG